MGGAELECGRIEIEAPESSKKLMLLFESFKKIRFLVGNADIAVTNSVIATEGGRQAGIGPAAAVSCGPAAGLLVFLECAALLALVSLVAEAGVVETQAVVAAALGCPGGGRAALAVRFVAGLVAAGHLAAVRGGDLRAFRREECCHGPAAAAAAAAAAAEAASSGVWDVHSALQRWIISSVVSKDRVLIRALMWRGSLRRKRATCPSFSVAGCRAVRLSHSTEGLVSPLHIG